MNYHFNGRKSLMIRFVTLALIPSIIIAGISHAHPGRTDASGCHTCRTNCAKYGLKDGEYHCHGAPAQPSATPQPAAQPKPQTSTAPPITQSARILSVIDGDTVDVQIDGKTERLRLIGIDTPETKDPRKPVQCYGREASARTAAILSPGRSVILEADPSQGERDKYGRLLRYVWLDKSTCFNLMMIRDGYAFEYTYGTPYKYQSNFKAAQKTAETAQSGLWHPSACSGKK